MSKDCNHNNILLKRNGTSQGQRRIDALSPDTVKLHDLSIEDWMAFAHAFAENVNYFDTETHITDGNWQRFFVEKEAIQNLLLEAETNKDLNPHLTLFVCFLRLMELSQNRLNNLSKRHLDFYYKEVLKLSNKQAVPDKVHLLFELAKNASDVRVEAGTATDAGKDANGNKRIYKTQNELIVNSAKVSALKNVLHKQGTGVKYSEIANSFDGLGGDFPDDNVTWWPFGHPNFKDSDGFPNLPNAKLGFAIASPILLLKEGLRTITFSITFGSNLPSAPSKKISDNVFEVLLSGEAEWISAPIDTVNSSVEKNTLKLVVEIPEATDPIVPYDKTVLLENFTSANPIARFLFKTGDDEFGYDFYEFLSGAIVTEIKIDVDVKNMQDIVLENDLGRLDASKPFFPFGPQPVRDSKFYIGCQEALNKPWTEVKIDMQWKDTPLYESASENDHFREHYLAYRKGHLKNLSKNTYTLSTDDSPDTIDDSDLIVPDSDAFKINLEVLAQKNWDQKITAGTLFNQNENGSYSSNFTISSTQDGSSGKGSKTVSKPKKTKGSGFMERIAGFGKLRNSTVHNDFLKVFNNSFFDFRDAISEGVSGLFDNPIQQESFSSNAKKGFIRIALLQSFLHDFFPRIYAIALSKKEEEKALIPNEPYTPLAESISIDYKASVSKTFNLSATSDSLKQNLGNYLDESLELFHEHPFGQSEQHIYLKTKHEFLGTKTQCTLVPKCDKGALFIGLENVKQLQQIALLIQVLEGSENPEYEGEQTYQGNEKQGWYILSQDEWKPLNNDFIVSNNTDNFLKSGIVKVSIPKEATSNNNRIPGDLFWIKVTNTKAFDAVCQLVNIHTQAEVAEFYNNDNEFSHLENGLPEKTISKLVERKATLKGVTQPYSSFDGVPKETDTQFYRRVSERLRHKQRAITIWDYEQLILQQFPKIYKVNCLKHTFGDSELAPGFVTVIAIPNIINQNIFDVYKPRISKAKRNEIQSFINGLNTLHVDAFVENPMYQEVKIALKVKFYEGKDESFYKKQLQKDISKFLAPWAYEETAEINFGLTLHESVVIYYIEQLDYVDYIKDFELLEETNKTDNQGEVIFNPVRAVVPANQKVILTSVKYEKHVVETISTNECVTT
ncbi:phage baseplate protein [Hwangdonia lutea]|uniref:Phage baseplate protein n=1 Tax=Hwangdonia lutea TaxID=3075823 RepID=A0AA97EJY3_9FLAO|nr:phage baseplate protein [Hwangdonia sp. SCSIO 19198]WOD42839.1 phage baseplate protein [Hwangdonia sp. SCSIO 19198]